MPGSWRFLAGLALGVMAAIAAFIGAIDGQLGAPTPSSQWLSDITQKQLRLADRQPGPRLLVVAGSSGLFGLNAAEIQRVTGCPTFNLSTHAALPIGYRLEGLKKTARPGDTILFAWEYEAYEGFYDPALFYDYILAHDPAYFRHLSLSEKIAFATRLSFARLQEGWQHRDGRLHIPPPRPPYSPYAPFAPGVDCLDENGDEIYNTPSQARAGDLGVTDVLLDFPWQPAAHFDQLASFITWAHAHRITVLATFPNLYWVPGYDAPQANLVIEAISDFYRAHGVPVAGTAREAMLHARGDFLDTHYHLQHDAALRRTDRLIPELQPYLPARR